jgi:hypothetical protein
MPEVPDAGAVRNATDDRPSIPVFDLPERLAAKADADLIAGDERHFAVWNGRWPS